MEVHALSKQQQGVFSVGEVCITLACCQLLVDATQAAVHCLRDTAELPQALSFQLLLLLLKPVQTPCKLFRIQKQSLTLNVTLLKESTPWTMYSHTKQCLGTAITCLYLGKIPWVDPMQYSGVAIHTSSS